MTNAKRDQNYVTTRLGVLFTDGTTLVPIAIDPSTGSIQLNTSSQVSQEILNMVKANKDDNYVTAMKGVSSEDGDVVLPIFVDSSGAILASVT